MIIEIGEDLFIGDFKDEQLEIGISEPFGNCTIGNINKSDAIKLIKELSLIFEIESGQQ